MTKSSPHTIKAFDDDLEQIRALLAEMGGRAEYGINGAMQALTQRDELSAAHIVTDDVKIDRMADEIERQCIRLIALRAPMADDLRTVLAAFKIAILVERVGDCARSIAEQVPRLRGFDRRLPFLLLGNMTEAATRMVHSALNAFVQQDSSLARQVCDETRAVDAYHDQLFRELLDTMSENPTKIGPATCLLLVSQKLERISDHASNIARVVFYSVTGDHMSARSTREA